VSDRRDSAPPVDDDGRDETVEERADRRWIEVLQELRVLQTGTQILTGFLLALAFQPVFADLGAGQRAIYLVLVSLAALSAVIALAPVALHRIVFRRRVKPEVVSFGHVSLIAALAAVSLLLTGVVAFVFDVILGETASWIAGIALGAVILVLWVIVPTAIRRWGRKPE
jgi:SNF family Na+-dependent transporter